MSTYQLNQANLTNFDQSIKTPSYDRQKLKAGIVHVGVGGFHRSHEAYYINQLLNTGSDEAMNWGICGVGLREADRNMADIMQQQDCLYTLVTQSPTGEVDNEVIGVMTDFLLAPNDPQAVIDKMADPETKIVSLTITEGGYNFNPATGEFDFENADVKHEIANPSEPKTIFGYLTSALAKRHEQGLPPFSVLSCDNVQHNGDVAKKMLLAFAKRANPQLAEWIEAEVSFPNCMVDRITPVTTPEVINLLELAGVDDAWPVVCEPFCQWVVEDNFSNGRPELEKVGVQFVPDVTPYETMKIRLLNASHSVLGILGAIHGHPMINSCMGDEVFVRFMRAFMDNEATPILGEVAGVDIEAYKDTLVARFANPNIKDSVSRICSESSAKLPKFLIPTIQENLAKGGNIQLATLVLATWCYYSDKQVSEQSEPLEIIDVQKQQLHDYASKTADDSLAFLQQAEIFGDLANNERFVDCYRTSIEAVYQATSNGQGIRGLMTELMAKMV